jgi:hypothetical protein
MDGFEVVTVIERPVEEVFAVVQDARVCLPAGQCCYLSPLAGSRRGLAARYDS